ncbi:hypothetical protein F4780DRAFT_778012 [Xylariomycetidae sp. FL0641]|nr:hypothetical protein F4780DRAFT_778012 [Xylariomycetidae sp. FL0641]
MADDHVVDLQQVYNRDAFCSTSAITPSITPAPSYSSRETSSTAAAPKSCTVCRNTLLLSYFNCCAICGNGIARGNLGSIGSHQEDLGANTQLPTRSDEKDASREEKRHCNSPNCKYTHNRFLLAVFVLFEATPLAGAVVLILRALFEHNWYYLRFRGLMAVQWWQIFVLPRQCHAGQSIISGQLAACLFMVWFYVEGRQDWVWFEPFAIAVVLMKILFPW